MVEEAGAGADAAVLNSRSSCTRPHRQSPFSGNRLADRGFAMRVEWTKDVDAALTHAKQESKPLLLDFSAAPM